MTAAEKKLLNAYLSILEGLSEEFKLIFIERLRTSLLKSAKNKSDFQSSFGAWESDHSADEIIKSIKASRNFDRQVEEL